MIVLIILTLAGVLTMFLGLGQNRRIPATVASAGIILAIFATLAEIRYSAELREHLYDTVLVNGMMRMDGPGIIFPLIMLSCALLVIPFGRSYFERPGGQTGEYMALMLFALVGGVMMATYMNLIMLFLGLEILSISVYCLTGSDRQNPRSNEAALKYFLQGAFFTGILLFGIALIYGATGTFELEGIVSGGFPIVENGYQLRLLGMLMLLAGMLFKVSAAPFHFWAPDVYEGAPTPITAFMATVVKTAGFAALTRVLLISFTSGWDRPILLGMLLICLVLTLLVGNLLALVQSSVKRMLAYSSIAHAGYLLVALVAQQQSSLSAILFYLLAYGLATVIAFGALALVAGQRKAESFDAFRGLGRNSPYLAAVVTISMSSLAGIPLTAGFIGKLYLFQSALDAQMSWMIVALVLGSAVSIYYYIKLVVMMYMSERTSESAIETTLSQRVAFGAAAFGTLLLGVAPDLLAYLSWISPVRS